MRQIPVKATAYDKRRTGYATCDYIASFRPEWFHSPARMSGDERDPMNPTSWYGEPDVCGSCIAWRGLDPRPGEEVAAGICKLRSELPRVPATMPKCNIYKPRGQFRYEPERHASPKRRRNKVLKVVRVEDGVEKPMRAPRPERPAPKPRAPREAVADGPFVPRTYEVRNVERPPEPPRPKDVDLGSDPGAPVIKQALVQMVRWELGNSRREMADKYKRGGRVAVRVGDKEKSISAEHFFSFLDRLQSSLSAFDKAADRYRDKLGASLTDEIKANSKRVRGSMTTFNVMFAHKEDHFRSK